MSILIYFYSYLTYSFLLSISIYSLIFSPSSISVSQISLISLLHYLITYERFLLIMAILIKSICFLRLSLELISIELTILKYFLKITKMIYLFNLLFISMVFQNHVLILHLLNLIYTSYLNWKIRFFFMLYLIISEEEGPMS